MVYFFCIARWIKCNHFFKVYIVCIARWINCNHFLQGLYRLQCKMNRTSLVSWRHSTGSLQISKERYFCLDCFIFFRIHYVYPIHYFTSENTGSLYLTYNLYCLGASNWTLDAINWTFGASNWSFGAINWTFDAINWTFGATASAILAKLQPRGRLLHLVGGDDVRLEASQAAMPVSINL